MTIYERIDALKSSIDQHRIGLTWSSNDAAWRIMQGPYIVYE